MALFLVLSFAVGTALLVLSLRLRVLSRRARHWPRVEGLVVQSRIDDAHLEFLKPVLRYQYEVAGVRYIGFRVSFSGYGISKAAMQQHIAPYAVGSKVQVSYDPAHPARAVLDGSAPSDWMYWCIAGLGFLGLGFYLLRL